MRISILFCICIIGLTKPCSSQSIESITPSNGFSGDQVVLHVNAHGTHFTAYDENDFEFNLVQGNYHMYFYDDILVINDTTLTVSVILQHDNPLGYYNFILKANGNPSLNLTKLNAFMVDPDPTPPTIISTYPLVSEVGKFIEFDIQTENTHFWGSHYDHFYLVKGNDTTRLNIMHYSYGTYIYVFATLMAPFDFPTGVYDVHVGSFQDGDMNAVNGLTLLVNPVLPELLSCSPDTVTDGGEMEVTLHARNTSFGALINYYYDLDITLRKTDNYEISSDFYHYNIYISKTPENDSTLVFR